MVSRKATARRPTASAAKKVRVKPIPVLRSHLQKVLGATEEQRATGLAAAAGESLLGRNDVAYILQGFPPDLGDAGGPPMYIDEVKKAMDRLRSEETQGRIAFPITPRELVDVARRTGISLPPAFENTVEAVPAAAKASKHGLASTKTRDEEIRQFARNLVDKLADGIEPFKKEDVVEQVIKKFIGVGQSNAYKIVSAAGIKWSEKKGAAADNARRAQSLK